MVYGIQFNAETKQFSVMSEKKFSFDPVTGEVITPAELKKRMESHGVNLKLHRTNVGGKGGVRFSGNQLEKIIKERAKHEAATRAAIAAKEAGKADRKAAGKIVAKLMKDGKLIKPMPKGKALAIAGGALAGSAALGAGVTAAVMAAKKRAAAKKAAEAAKKD